MRDIGQTSGQPLTTVMLFLSPVFYPAAAFPESYRVLLYANPLTFLITQAQDLLIWGKAPSWVGIALYWAGSYPRRLVRAPLVSEDTKGVCRCPLSGRSVSAISKTYRLYDRPRDRGNNGSFLRCRNVSVDRPHSITVTYTPLTMSFEVLKGETLGIIGRNGSGKSTLLQLIVGILSPTSGTIETNGRIAALLELGGWISSRIYGTRKCILNATLLGLSWESLETQLDEILRFAEIGAAIDQPLKPIRVAWWSVWHFPS